MQEIEINLTREGTAYDIGYQHGTFASGAIKNNINTYAELFKKNAHMTWQDVREECKMYEYYIAQRFLKLYGEMKGVADGSGNDILDIIALNCRTEIAFGRLKYAEDSLQDGCTSMYQRYKSSDGKEEVMMGQNWDWLPAIGENIILMTVRQPELPSIKMVTEAGIIGKIGFNSSGVGVCFNALRISGVSPQKLPVHLALRVALESSSVEEAYRNIKLLGGGIASASFVLIGDGKEALGLENTSETVVEQRIDESGGIVHANSLLFTEEHKNKGGRVDDGKWVEDSTNRVNRMKELVEPLFAEGKSPSLKDVRENVFTDEKNWPNAICREANEKLGSDTKSLFNMMIDLKNVRAVLKEGRPCDYGRELELSFPQEEEDGYAESLFETNGENGVEKEDGVNGAASS